MTRKKQRTYQRLLEAAETLIAEESLAQLKIERITERAGVSRRTFFLHFPSKDHLLAAIMGKLRPDYVERFKTCADACGPAASPADRIVQIFDTITAAARDPEWRGSFFIRIAAELGHLRGHPVHAVVAAANRDVEDWLADELAAAGYANSQALARQLLVLINGLLTVQLITRSTAYGEDTRELVRALLTRD